jgi:5-methylcytosine-specific restriction endonuclease McrA
MEIILQDPSAIASPRPAMPKPLQVRVFVRDKWLCQTCRRPVIFAPAMRLLAGLIRQDGIGGMDTAYYHPNWSRTSAPLLDELGACVDHVLAHVRGGKVEFGNLATICSKCNVRKGALDAAEHLRRQPLRKIRAKYGEPENWDGLSGVFVALAAARKATLTPTDRHWLRVLTVKR